LIIVTGAAGFIGSCMVSKLNRLGRDDILAVDALDETEKWKNLRKLSFDDYIDRDALLAFLERPDAAKEIEAVIHMGACSSTTERDAGYLMENNYRYSLTLARFALSAGARFIYASSAATYGDGDRGYSDNEGQLAALEPMNMYGYSKHLFDLKAKREGWLNRCAGLKFFNVYGPNEYHKGDMTSVAFKATRQIRERGRVALFKSHRPDFEDGGQMRDFVYVLDAVAVMAFLLERPDVNGLFNLGTGQARCFKDLALAVFHAMDREPAIDYIDMPESIRDRYQYHTQADMAKLRAAGYDQPFHSLEDGVADYVSAYLTADPPRHY